MSDLLLSKPYGWLTRNDHFSFPKSLILGMLVVVSCIITFPSHAQTASKIRVAILYFENNAAEKSLVPLSKGLCDMMISDFSNASRFSVVERNKLEEVFKELKLGQTRSFDSATTARIGKLLGAEYLVFGSYFEFLGRFRIDARIVKVETGQITASVGVTGKVDEFDFLEKKIVASLHEKMNRPIPDSQTKDKKVSLRSAAHYGQALDKMDSGDVKGARELLRDIVESSPDFALAKETLQKISK